MRLLILLISVFLLSCNSKKDPVLQIELATVSDSLTVFAPGIISTHHPQRDICISADGKEIFYTQSTPSNNYRAIVQVTLDGSRVTSSEVPAFSGKHSDIEPFLTPNQNRLYFASDRPIHDADTVSDYNIWYVEREGSAWSNPIPLGDSVNTPEGNEFYPSLSSNGNLYFTASYQRGLEFIWKSEWKNGAYGKPMKLDSAINSSRYQFNAYISADESTLIFSSFGRPDGFGGGDLYASVKDEEGQWQPAYNLGPEINSKKLDYCPFWDENRGIFYFTSNRTLEINEKMDLTRLNDYNQEATNGLGSIYQIKMDPGKP